MSALIRDNSGAFANTVRVDRAQVALKQATGAYYLKPRGSYIDFSNATVELRKAKHALASDKRVVSIMKQKITEGIAKLHDREKTEILSPLRRATLACPHLAEASLPKAAGEEDGREGGLKRRFFAPKSFAISSGKSGFLEEAFLLLSKDIFFSYTGEAESAASIALLGRRAINTLGSDLEDEISPSAAPPPSYPSRGRERASSTAAIHSRISHLKSPKEGLTKPRRIEDPSKQEIKGNRSVPLTLDIISIGNYVILRNRSLDKTPFTIKELKWSRYKETSHAVLADHKPDQKGRVIDVQRCALLNTGFISIQWGSGTVYRYYLSKSNPDSLGVEVFDSSFPKRPYSHSCWHKVGFLVNVDFYLCKE